MTAKSENTWNPETYARFRGLRLRPAVDLLQQIGDLPAGAVIDLGCGNGAVGPALAARFPDHPLIGVDSSPDMLAKADETGAYDELLQADITDWAPDAPPALIFSNAALNWVPEHARHMPRLAAILRAGGTLAIQMPGQHDQPSHRLAREVAQTLFPDRFPLDGPVAHVLDPADYHAMLSPLGQFNAWETTYLQQLDPAAGHPVRKFAESTYLLPYLHRMDPAEHATYITTYEHALTVAYPAQPDGRVLFPFRRVFLTLTV